MELQSDRDRTIFAMTVARSWTDPSFKQRLLQNPTAVLSAEGLSLPVGSRVEVLEESPALKYVMLASNASPAEIQEKLSALMSTLSALPEGQKLTVVRSTDTTRYLILPMKGGDVSSQSMPFLISMAADASVATETNSVQTAETVTTEVQTAETTTTEAGEVETTVVAVAEIVLT